MVLSNSRVYACGDSGKLIYSTDLGVFWSSMNSGTTEDLQCITSPPNSSFTIAVGKHGIVVKISFVENYI